MPLLIDKQKFLDALPFHLTPDDLGWSKIPFGRHPGRSRLRPDPGRCLFLGDHPLGVCKHLSTGEGTPSRSHGQPSFVPTSRSLLEYRLSGMTFQLPSRSVTMQADTLVNEPDLALEPPIAYQIAARGMREGWFTGHKLRDYIPAGQPPDYFNARKIINGLDHSKAIARYARAFEKFLREAIQTAAESAPA